MLALCELVGSSPPGFGVVRVTHRFSFLWFFLRPDFCVPNAANVSGMFILDCPSVFSEVYLCVVFLRS